jgi:hypothetical protein
MMIIHDMDDPSLPRLSGALDAAAATGDDAPTPKEVAWAC